MECAKLVRHYIRWYIPTIEIVNCRLTGRALWRDRSIVTASLGLSVRRKEGSLLSRIYANGGEHERTQNQRMTFGGHSLGVRSFVSFFCGWWLWCVWLDGMIIRDKTFWARRSY